MTLREYFDLSITEYYDNAFHGKKLILLDFYWENWTYSNNKLQQCKFAAEEKHK